MSSQQIPALAVKVKDKDAFNKCSVIFPFNWNRKMGRESASFLKQIESKWILLEENSFSEMSTSHFSQMRPGIFR